MPDMYRSMMHKALITALLLCFAFFSSYSKGKIESVQAVLAPGETVSLPETFVRTDVVLKASLKFSSFGKVRIGLGQDCYCGGWLEITPGSFTFYDRCKIRIDTVGTRHIYHFDTLAVSNTRWNDKPLKRKLSITIESRKRKAALVMESGNVSYSGAVDRWWEGGEPFVTNLSDSPMEVTLSFERKKADERIWFYADSYFSTGSPLRWPHYMYNEGYDNWMADHIPGGGSPQLLECFRHDLDFGTPEIAVWMLGMNDGSDKDGKPSAKWLECISEFISICNQKGIIPVLTTIPTVPGRFHDCKTEWVRNSGYRYIDWYKACGTDSEGNWTEGYLFRDKVHPDKAGALALWQSVKSALPELSRNLPGSVKSDAEEAVAAYRKWKGRDMTVAFPIITDVHTNAAGRPFLHFIDWDVALDSLFNFDFMANLGDICTKMNDGILKSTATKLLGYAGVSVYVPGNHDYDGENGRHYTHDELSGELLDSFMPRSGGRLHRVKHESYGWYDIPEKKCRVIFLDSMQSETKGGRYYIYGDSQLAWLDSLLRDTPSAWSVIALSHFMPHKNFGLWNPEKELAGSGIDASIWRLQEVLADYVKGGGRLAGLFCGDAHCSAFDSIDGVNMYVSQGLGGYPQECIREGISHIRCDFNCDFLLDIVAVKPGKREVAVFRVGAGGRKLDRYFNY